MGAASARHCWERLYAVGEASSRGTPAHPPTCVLKSRRPTYPGLLTPPPRRRVLRQMARSVTVTVTALSVTCRPYLSPRSKLRILRKQSAGRRIPGLVPTRLTTRLGDKYGWPWCQLSLKLQAVDRGRSSSAVTGTAESHSDDVSDRALPARMRRPPTARRLPSAT